MAALFAGSLSSTSAGTKPSRAAIPAACSGWSWTAWSSGTCWRGPRTAPSRRTMCRSLPCRRPHHLRAHTAPQGELSCGWEIPGAAAPHTGTAVLCAQVPTSSTGSGSSWQRGAQEQQHKPVFSVPRGAANAHKFSVSRCPASAHARRLHQWPLCRHSALWSRPCHPREPSSVACMKGTERRPQDMAAPLQRARCCEQHESSPRVRG